MKIKRILIFFLLFTLLYNNIAYSLSPSSRISELQRESRYRYISKEIEKAEHEGTLNFQILQKDIPGYGIDELKQMLAQLIYENIYLGKVSVPEEQELKLWEFCKDFDLDLEGIKPIDISSHVSEKAYLDGVEIAKLPDGEVKMYKINNRLILHLICALLDEYFVGLDYSVSHIPRVLGWNEKNYYYQLAEGDEGFDTYIEYDQEGNIVNPYASRTLYDKRALYLFDTFFSFSNDFADPEDARGSGKNAISDTRNLGNLDSIDNPFLPRTWKLIDFESKSGGYRTELPKFLSEHGEDIRQALGEEKYKLLTIAVKQLLLLKPSFRKYRFQKLFKKYQAEKIAEIFEEQRLGKIKILVNGIGVVGKRLVSALKVIGFDVCISDLDKEKVTACVREYNCKSVDVSKLNEVEFNLIIDTSPAGTGVDNWNNLYSQLPYTPKIIFQGGEDRNIPFGIRIESCNISAMGAILNPILERFSGLEIEDYYDRSKDESIGGLGEYEPYNHGAQFEEAYPEARGGVTKFNSYRRNGHIEGYHLHKTTIKGKGLTSKEVKELIQSYSVLVLDETLTNGIPFENIIEDLARFRKTQEIPLLFVRVANNEGGVTLEYAVPHRVNVVPDNIASIFSILGIDNSILHKRYQDNINKNKKRIEDFLYRSYTYLYPLRKIFNEYMDMWRIAHLDNSGKLAIGYLDISLLAKRIESELGWTFPEDRDECRRWITEIFKTLFGIRAEMPGTSVIELQHEKLEALRSA